MYSRHGCKSVLVSLITVFSFVLLSTSNAFAQVQLNGISVHTHLGKDQFMAATYAETLTTQNTSYLLAEEEKRMELKVLAESIPSRAFRQLWIEGVAINSSTEELQKHAQNLADFSNLLKPRLMQGDVLVIQRVFGLGVELSINGVVFGAIEDTSFFDLLARTWVGAVPLSSSFRENLLKAGDIDVSVKTEYASISPSAARVAKMEALVASVKQAELDLIAAAKKEAEDKIAAAKAKEAEARAAKARAAKARAAKARVAKAKATPRPKPKPTVKPRPVKPKPKVVAKLQDDDEEVSSYVYTAKSLLAKQLYIAALNRWTGPYVRYPQSALRKGYEGSLRLSVKVNRQGKVTFVEVTESSGYRSLDKAALSAVKRASPYPKIPDDLSEEVFSFAVPISFAFKK